MTKIELVNKLAKETMGRVWTKNIESTTVYITRVYYKKGYAEIKDNDEIYFETVYRTNFDDVKQFAMKHNLKRVYA